MSEIIKSEAISRRKALSIMGLAAAFALAAPPTMLTVSDAEAQVDQPAPGGETGPERREGRREHRRERRHERREDRRERRHERRAHRRERHEERREHRRDRREEPGTGTEEKK
jgi:hypothetical protein